MNVQKRRNVIEVDVNIFADVISGKVGGGYRASVVPIKKIMDHGAPERDCNNGEVRSGIITVHLDCNNMIWRIVDRSVDCLEGVFGPENSVNGQVRRLGVEIIVADTDATMSPNGSVSVTAMILWPSTSPLTRALHAPPVIVGALTVAVVLVEIVRSSPGNNVPVMVWLEFLVGVSMLMFRKFWSPVTTCCALFFAAAFPTASTDKGYALIPLSVEPSIPLAEKFATVKALVAGRLAPAATSNPIVRNSPTGNPPTLTTTICTWAGVPLDAGVYLATTRLLLPAAAAPRS